MKATLFLKGALLVLVMIPQLAMYVEASWEKWQQFSNVKVDFCDLWETARWAKIVWFEDFELNKELCIKASNNNDEPIAINIDIVDGAINEYGNIACYNKSYKWSIGKFIQNETLHIEIEPWQTVEEKIQLKRDSGTVGQFFGCIHYYLDATKSTGMFQANIGSTKKFIIDIAGKLVAKIKLTSPDGSEENRIYIEKKINRLKAILKIINEWNVGQKWFYSWSVDWLVWEPKEFNGNFFLQGWENKELVEQLDLPWYAVFWKLEMKLIFEPQATLGYHDAARDPSEKMEKQQYDLTENIINYYLLFIVVCLIIVEMRYLSYRKRKHRQWVASSYGPVQNSWYSGQPMWYAMQANNTVNYHDNWGVTQASYVTSPRTNGQQYYTQPAPPQTTNQQAWGDTIQQNQNNNAWVYCENCGNTLNPSIYPEWWLSIIARNKISDDTYEPWMNQN